MKHFIRSILCVTIVLGLLSTAEAMQFQPPWTNFDSFTLDFNEINSNLPSISDFDSYTHSGWGYVQLNPDGTFTDYVVYNVSDFEDKWGNSLGPSTYGTNSTGGSWYLTFEAVLTGHVIFTSGQENFTFDSLNYMNTYLDHAWDADGLTDGSFQNNLQGYLDGTVIVQGISLVDSGNSQGNSGYIGSAPGDNGEYNVALSINDVYGIMETSAGIDLKDLWEVLAWDSDGDLTRHVEDPNDPTNDASAIAAEFRKYYGLPDPSQSFIYVIANQKGSMDTAAIPEPATMLLVGSGLIGLAGLGRRKFFKKG